MPDVRDAVARDSRDVAVDIDGEGIGLRESRDELVQVERGGGGTGPDERVVHRPDVAEPDRFVALMPRAKLWLKPAG